MHVAGSQELLPNLAGSPFQGLQAGEELLMWHSEELRDLPRKKRTIVGRRSL